MGYGNFLHFLSLLFCIWNFFPHSLAEPVTLTVKSVTTIARTDDPFVCATIDWWPSTKCNYDMCPWGKASFLNLDLSNKVLPKAIKAFNPLRIRIGGSLQDQLVYNVDNKIKNCEEFKKSSTGLFGFTSGCLSMKRWDEVNRLFGKSGAVVTFGLNALYGRKTPKNKDSKYTGDWNSSNTRDFIKYTVSKGYKVDSWELGNELSGSGVSAKVDAAQYAKDIRVLKNLLQDLYKNSTIKPKIWAPGGFFESQWFADFLQASGPNVVDLLTHHIYNLGPGGDPKLIEKLQDPYVLDNTIQSLNDILDTIQRFGPTADAAISEAGGAYNSGGKASHTFLNSFWYLDNLGATSAFNHKVFCRQTLIGGNYGLLNTETMMPNPDYYSGLLFHRLMGRGVLSTTHNGSPYLRAYSHCSRTKPGITLLLINLSNSTSFDVSVVNDLNLYPHRSLGEINFTGRREEYHLTPKDGILTSETMLLNGAPLEIDCHGDMIPSLPPKIVLDGSSPISIAHSSILFVSLKDFRAPACA